MIIDKLKPISEIEVDEKIKILKKYSHSINSYYYEKIASLNIIDNKYLKILKLDDIEYKKQTSFLDKKTLIEYVLKISVEKGYLNTIKYLVSNNFHKSLFDSIIENISKFNFENIYSLLKQQNKNYFQNAYSLINFIHDRDYYINHNKMHNYYSIINLYLANGLDIRFIDRFLLKNALINNDLILCNICAKNGMHKEDLDIVMKILYRKTLDKLILNNRFKTAKYFESII